MHETLLDHIALAGGILVPILLAWIDLRVSVSRIETKIDPLWIWWNRRANASTDLNNRSSICGTRGD